MCACTTSHNAGHAKSSQTCDATTFFPAWYKSKTGTVLISMTSRHEKSVWYWTVKSNLGLVGCMGLLRLQFVTDHNHSLSLNKAGPTLVFDKVYSSTKSSCYSLYIETKMSFFCLAVSCRIILYFSGEQTNNSILAGSVANNSLFLFLHKQICESRIEQIIAFVMVSDITCVCETHAAFYNQVKLQLVR